MEYLSGPTLQEYEKEHKGKISEKQAEILLEPVINALAYIHSIGIVHCDISPDNLIFNKEGQLKLIDFGAAKNKKKEKEEIVETCLTNVGLWNEVKDALFKKGTFLSGGQQQRLCIARALALKPEVLLMDEPTSALDPIATNRIEELLLELKKEFTIIIVTHNMSQAARISDYSMFMYLGELIEYDKTRIMFTNPRDKRTEEYLTGQFG